MNSEMMKNSEKLECAVKAVLDDEINNHSKFEILRYLFQLYETAKEDEACSDT